MTEETVTLELPRGYKAVFRTEWYAGDQERIDNLVSQYSTDAIPWGTVRLTVASCLLVSLHNAEGKEVKTDMDSLRKIPASVYDTLTTEAMAAQKQIAEEAPKAGAKKGA